MLLLLFSGVLLSFGKLRFTHQGRLSNTSSLRSVVAGRTLVVEKMLLLSALSVALAVTMTYALDVGQILTMGDTAFANGEFNSAVRHYTSAIDLDPSTVMLYTKRAAAYMSPRQHSQALRDLDR
jgi:hypothetical protein